MSGHFTGQNKLRVATFNVLRIYYMPKARFSSPPLDARSIANFLQRFALVRPSERERGMRFILLVAAFPIFSSGIGTGQACAHIGVQPQLSCPLLTTTPHLLRSTRARCLASPNDV
jgi:hypothetical protein